MRPAPWPTAGHLLLACVVSCASPPRASLPDAVGPAAPAPAAPTRSQGASAFAVDSAVRAMAAHPLWPGWDPLATPLAIYDGTNTVVFRHPSPGPAYQSLSRAPGVWARVGRDPAITANSSAMLGGVPTATVMLAGDASATAEAAGALAIHELFHVYQRRAHPAWTANEADLFTYPAEDVDALALRREETFALSEALESADDADEAACWAAAFAALRERRFAALGGTAAAYERGTELNEGLARYVELTARGARLALDVNDFPAGEFRQRAYGVGAAQAAVLEQLVPGWRDSLERAPAGAGPALDGLLARAAARRRTPSSPQCSAREEHRTRWRTQAADDVAALRRARLDAAAEYRGLAGWRIELVATTPLFPQGFDPLNVIRTDSVSVLHTRFVTLGREGATLQVLGRAALTTGAGPHPLFNGVRRVLIAGLPSAPSLRDSAGMVLLTADGVRGRFATAIVDMGEGVVKVVLP